MWQICQMNLELVLSAENFRIKIKNMKKIVFEYKDGNYVETYPVFLCSKCFKNLCQSTVTALINTCQ